MKRRWSMGVAVAIAVAVAAAFASGGHAWAPQQVSSPVQVTVALQPDGLMLRVAAGTVAVTFEM